ncbi:MAG: SCP2 sterol-binding domain-containing protein [Cellvibrionaceae bacterium]|nr:SCP2 sterol-binding domain-containing protein [Cellvibrionaceae bacterium]
MAIGLTAKTAALALLEAAINKALNYDPGSQAALEKLHDSLLQIDCTQPEFTLFINCRNAKLYLSSAKSVAADASISGKLPNLMALLNKSQHSLAHSGVDCAGNLTLINDYQKLLANLDIDWQAILAQVFGDVASTPLAMCFEGMSTWAKTRRQQIPQHVSEFLQSEVNLIPSQNDLASFCGQVDELRSATDRLQAKIEQLAAATQKSRHSSSV